jgi:hypothetical protein
VLALHSTAKGDLVWLDPQRRDVSFIGADDGLKRHRD